MVKYNYWIQIKINWEFQWFHRNAKNIGNSNEFDDEGKGAFGLNIYSDFDFSVICMKIQINNNIYISRKKENLFEGNNNIILNDKKKPKYE